MIYACFHWGHWTIQNYKVARDIHLRHCLVHLGSNSANHQLQHSLHWFSKPRDHPSICPPSSCFRGSSDFARISVETQFRQGLRKVFRPTQYSCFWLRSMQGWQISNQGLKHFDLKIFMQIKHFRLQVRNCEKPSNFIENWLNALVFGMW